MRPIPARVLLAASCLGALATGLLTSQFIFFVVAFGSAILLGTSLGTSRRPVTHALRGLRNHSVEVRLWGSPPPDISDTTLVLASVNALGAGVHVYFNVRGGGALHLKIAQPGNPSLAPHCVVFGSARYVQWNGKRLSRVAGAPAVTIALSELPASGRPESVATPRHAAYLRRSPLMLRSGGTCLHSRLLALAHRAPGHPDTCRLT